MLGFKAIYSHIMGIGEIQRQSIVSLIWQITYTGVGFLSTVYFAHTVGADILGAYFLFLAYIKVISLFSEGGLGGAAVKRISEGEEQNEYFSASFILRMVFIIFVLLLLVIFREYFVDLNNAGLFIWFLLVLVVSSLYSSIQNAIAGSNKMGIFATTNFIKNLSSVVIQVIAVYLGYEARGLVGGFILGMVVASIIGLRFFDLHFVWFGWKHIKHILSFSGWLFLTSSGIIIYSNTDILMIGYFLNNAEVGIYTVVLQFASFAILVATELRGVLWPKVSYWGKNGKINLIEKSLSQAFSYSLMVAIPILAGGVLLGDKLLYFLYGTEFASGYLPFVILLFVQIANIFQYLLTSYLSALDHQKDAFKVTFIAAMGNILLNAALIPIIGLLGAAIATLLTMALNTLMARQALSRMVRVRIEYSKLKNILISTVLMSLIVGLYRLTIPLSTLWLTMIPVILGGITYGLLLLKLDGEINKELKGIANQMNIPWPNWLQ